LYINPSRQSVTVFTPSIFMQVADEEEEDPTMDEDVPATDELD
jgi:hypothetical protein